MARWANWQLFFSKNIFNKETYVLNRTNIFTKQFTFTVILRLGLLVLAGILDRNKNNALGIFSI